MNAPVFQVQWMLRCYSRQLANKSGASKATMGKTKTQRDDVTISPEGRRRLLADKITLEMINQLMGGTELSPMFRSFLETLAQEYGQALEILNDDEKGIIFKGLDRTDGKMKLLSPSENEGLKERLIEIIQSTVKENLGSLTSCS